jgi:hypothetical protein
MNNKDYKKLERQREKIVDERTKCGKQKCASINKILTQKNKIFEKEHDIKCPKTSKLFYDCTTKFYDDDKNKVVKEYKLYSDKFYKCRSKKCIKFIKKLKSVDNKTNKINRKIWLNNNKTKNNNTIKTKNNIKTKTMKGGNEGKTIEEIFELINNPNLQSTELDISNSKQLTYDDIETIANSLKDNKYFVKLNISKCNIDNNKAYILLQNLQNSNISDINMSNNNLTPDDNFLMYLEAMLTFEGTYKIINNLNIKGNPIYENKDNEIINCILKKMENKTKFNELRKTFCTQSLFDDKNNYQTANGETEV